MGKYSKIVEIEKITIKLSKLEESINQDIDKVSFDLEEECEKERVVSKVSKQVEDLECEAKNLRVRVEGSAFSPSLAAIKDTIKKMKEMLDLIYKDSSNEYFLKYTQKECICKRIYVCEETFRNLEEELQALEENVIKVCLVIDEGKSVLEAEKGFIDQVSLDDETLLKVSSKIDECTSAVNEVREDVMKECRMNGGISCSEKNKLIEEGEEIVLECEELIKRASMITEEIEHARTRERCFQEIMNIDQKLKNLSNEEINRENMFETLNQVEGVINLCEEKWDGNDHVTLQKLELTKQKDALLQAKSYFNNFFSEFDKKKKDLEEKIITVNVVENMLKNDVRSIRNHEDKVRFLEDLRSKLAVSKEEEIENKSKFKEAEVLDEQRSKHNKRIECLERSIIKEIEVENFEWLLSVSAEIIENLKVNNFTRTKEEVIKFVLQLEEMLENLEKKKDDIKEKYEEEVNDLHSVKEELKKLKESIKLMEEVILECEAFKKEHSKQMKVLKIRPKESRENVTEVEKLLEEHWKVISLKKAQVNNIVSCVEIKGVNDLYDNMLEEVEELLENMTEHSLRITEQEEFVSAKKVTLASIKSEFILLKEEVKDDAEKSTTASVSNNVELIKERLSSFEEDLRVNVDKMSSQDHANIMDEMLGIKDCVETFYETLKDQIEGLDTIKKEIFKLDEFLKEEALNIVDESKKENVLKKIDTFKNIKEELLNAKIKLGMLDIRCRERRKSLLNVDEIISTLDNKLEEFEEKKTLIIEKDTCIEGLRGEVKRVLEGICDFRDSMVHSGEDRITTSQLTLELIRIQAMLENVCKPSLISEKEYENFKKEAEDLLSDSSVTLSQLLQDSEAELNDLISLEVQLEAMKEKVKDSNEQSASGYCEMKGYLESIMEIKTLSQVLRGSVEDTNGRLMTIEQCDLNKRCTSLCNNLEDLSIQVEGQLKSIEKVIRGSLENVKGEHERWIQNSMTSLQSSTSPSNKSMENIQLRKNAIDNLEESLSVGEDLIEKINSLEEQMRIINPKFSIHECVYITRKISSIDFKNMVKDSKQIYTDIVERHTNGRRIYQELEDCLDEVKNELCEAKEVQFTMKEIESKIVNLMKVKGILDVKSDLIKDLVEMDKKLIQEDFTMDELNVLDLENRFIKAHEDVDDLLVSLKQTKENYDQLNEDFITVKCNISSMIKEIEKNAESTSEMSTEERIKYLEEVGKKLSEKLEDISLLRTRFKNFYFERNIMSEVPENVQDLEDKLNQFIEKINGQLQDSLDQFDKQKELERKLGHVRTDLNTLLEHVTRITTLNLLEADEEEVEDITEEIKEIQQKFDTYRRTLGQLDADPLASALNDGISETKEFVLKAEEHIQEVVDKIDNVKTLKAYINQMKHNTGLIEADVVSTTMCDNKKSDLEESLNVVEKIVKDISICKTLSDLLIPSDLLTKEEQEYLNYIRQEKKNELEKLETTVNDLTKIIEEGLRFWAKVNMLETELYKLSDDWDNNGSCNIEDLEAYITKNKEIKEELESCTDLLNNKEYKNKVTELHKVTDELETALTKRNQFIISTKEVQLKLKESENDLELLNNIISFEFGEIKDKGDDAQVLLDNALENLVKIRETHEMLTKDISNENSVFGDNELIIKNQIILLEDIQKKITERNEDRIEQSYTKDEESELPVTTEEMASSTEVETENSEDACASLEAWLQGRGVPSNGGREIIETLLKEVAERTSALNNEELSFGDNELSEHYQNLRKNLSSYEKDLKDAHRQILDVESKMNTFSKQLLSAMEWIDNKFKVLEESIDIEEECQKFEENVLKDLRNHYSVLIELNGTRNNIRLFGHVNDMLQSVLSKYDDLRVSIIENIKNKPQTVLEQAIMEAEDFINYKFPDWYKQQMKKTIICSKECMVRISETRMNVSMAQNMSSNINKLVTDQELPWPMIILDQDSVYITGSRTIEESSVLYGRYSVIRSSLKDIYLILNKWLEILEDLKIKWQELSANQDQFESWLQEMHSKNDVYNNQMFQLNHESLSNKVYSLQILKREIEANAQKLVDIMVKDDRVTTVTFSPELNNGDYLTHTETLSDKINAQYVCLLERICAQMDCWRNIIDKFDKFKKSSEDLKQDFDHLKERVGRLELHSPLMVDQWHFLQNNQSADSYQSNPRLEVNYSYRNYLRNSGSNRGISKLFWPYSHVADHSGGDCESNKLSRSLLCLNSEDLRNSRDFTRTFCEPSSRCLESVLNNNTCPIKEPYLFCSESINATNLSDRSINLRIKESRGTIEPPLNSSRNENTVKRIKRIITPINGSSGYRSSSSSLASTYRF